MTELYVTTTRWTNRARNSYLLLGVQQTVHQVHQILFGDPRQLVVDVLHASVNDHCRGRVVFFNQLQSGGCNCPCQTTKVSTTSTKGGRCAWVCMPYHLVGLTGMAAGEACAMERTEGRLPGRAVAPGIYQVMSTNVASCLTNSQKVKGNSDHHDTKHTKVKLQRATSTDIDVIHTSTEKQVQELN